MRVDPEKTCELSQLGSTGVVLEDVGRDDLDDGPVASLDPVASKAVVDAIPQSGVELDAEELADDTLLLPDQVAETEPVARTAHNRRIELRLGQPGPHDHETTTGFHG